MQGHICWNEGALRIRWVARGLGWAIASPLYALSKLLAQGNGVVDGDFLFVDGNHFVLAQIT